MDKHIWKIDLVLILLSVGVLMGIFGYAQPLVIAPIDEYASLEGGVLFEFEGADVLMIDDNMEFSSPDEYRVLNGLILELEPGIYYWKVKGVLGSEVRTLTIKSVLELMLVETEDGMAVVNAGNVRLNVDVYDGEELVERKKLGVDGELGIKDQESVRVVGGME